MESVSVIVEDDPNPITLSDAAVNYFELVKQLSVISSGPIVLNIPKDIFKKIVEFGEINEYQPLKVAAITTNNLKLALEGDEKNYNFISTYKGSMDPQLAKLFKAAEYIKCESLMLLIAVLVGCQMYFGDSNEEYQKVKQKFGVVQDITYEQDEEYTRNYVYMSQ